MQRGLTSQRRCVKQTGLLVLLPRDWTYHGRPSLPKCGDWDCQDDHTGRIHGFQLWANLPSALKMTVPRYQEVKTADIPEATYDDATHVRVICGRFWGKKGLCCSIRADASSLPGEAFAHPTRTGAAILVMLHI